MRLSTKMEFCRRQIKCDDCGWCVFEEKCDKNDCIVMKTVDQAIKELKKQEDIRLEEAKAIKQFAEEKWKEEEAYKKKLVKHLNKVIGELDE